MFQQSKSYSSSFYYGIFSLFVLIIIISACMKSPDTNPTNNTIGKPPMSGLVPCNPHNPANPYDSIGIYHNLGLDAIVSNTDTLSCDSINLWNQYYTK